MHTNEPSPARPSFFAVRTSALALVALSACTGAWAQQATVPVGPEPSLMASVSAAPLDLAKVDLATAAGVNYSSSSSVTDGDAVEARSVNFTGDASDALQPPPRRRYGRPRYNDSRHNPDGSDKYAFMAGVGLTLATGNTAHYLNTDYAFQVGGGRNFNKNFSLLLQFDYDHFGFNGRTLYNQSVLYDPTNASGIIGNLDGKSHVWSITVDPVYNFYTRQGLGAYVVGGVGFYHKTANFTVPATGTYCDYYYGCYQYQANQTIDKYTSNGVGFSGGFGLTLKPSQFAGQRLYVEARYVYMDNQQKDGLNASNPNYNPNYVGNNGYRPNSNRTTYIPIKAGIRF